MSESHAVFHARRSDAERLLAAGRVCYLLGGYDGSGNYGDILQLVGTLARIRPSNATTLAAPVISAVNAASHADLVQDYPELFGDACFLYLSHSGGTPIEPGAFAGMVALPSPPPADWRLLIYGGGFFNERWGREKLDAIEAVEAWERTRPPGRGGRAVVGRPKLAMTGQQVSPSFLAGDQADRFRSLLRRAEVVGVRDPVSLGALTSWDGFPDTSKAFLSGDDAVTAIAAAAARGPGGRVVDVGGDVTHGGSSGHDSVCLHLSAEDYVTDRTEQLASTVDAIISAIAAVLPGRLDLGLLAAFEDRRISESRFLREFAPRVAARCRGVGIVRLISEFELGFPRIGDAGLCVACSYHVALTSLMLSVPTLMLRGNDYYAQKHAGLRQVFGLPEDLLFDFRDAGPEGIAQVAVKVMTDEASRRDLRSSLRIGTARLVEYASVASSRVVEFLR